MLSCTSDLSNIMAAIKMVPRLTDKQIARERPAPNPACHPTPPPHPNAHGRRRADFKQHGYLVLPAALDQGLCARVRDEMWATLTENLPRLQRGNPGTWGPFTGDEQRPRRPETNSFEGGDLYFEPTGHRFVIRNGAEELLLDLCPRALFDVAEQLLGKGDVVYPGGVNAAGMAAGPAFLDEGAQSGMQTHADTHLEPTWQTETLELPGGRGPVWMNGEFCNSGLAVTVAAAETAAANRARNAGAVLHH
eukprot:COSAG04_NODE_3700_length_2596_cov_1.663997_1_plen_248_part_10